MSSASLDASVNASRRVMPGVRLLRVEFERHARLVAFAQRAAARSPVDGSRPSRAAALPLTLDIARGTLNHSFRGGWRTLNNFKHGQPNIGMHPTGQSDNVIRKVGGLCQCFPAGDAGRSVASH
jgi:hypothetical protein